MASFSYAIILKLRFLPSSTFTRETLLRRLMLHFTDVKAFYTTFDDRVRGKYRVYIADYLPTQKYDPVRCTINPAPAQRTATSLCANVSVASCCCTARVPARGPPTTIEVRI